MNENKMKKRKKKELRQNFKYDGKKAERIK